MTNEIAWPESYIQRINQTTEICLADGIEASIKELRSIQLEYAEHPNFIDHHQLLEQSIVRNTILMLTLSNEQLSKDLLERLLNSESSLNIFDYDEKDELQRAIEGKLRDFALRQNGI